MLSSCALVAALAIAAGSASASPYVQYGVQDDAWLLTGNGTLDGRLATLDRLGVDIVRVTVRWDQVAPRRPGNARNPRDPAYDWSLYDEAFDGLRSRGIGVLVTLWGTPAWANGGRAPNWAPTASGSLAAFAYAASKRYPWIHRWAIWNEPNLRLSFRPTSPSVYTTRLLNPAYAALKAASRANRIAGGVTAPRGGESGMSPVTWIRRMRAAHAHLDAYAQNPYPLSPRETPTSGGCMRCATYTMATLPKLIAEVKRDFGSRTRIWLTEYGYNSKPPSTWLGVPNRLQARFVEEAAHRAYELPKVDLLINYLVRDEPDASRWTSGFITSHGSPKLSFRAFSLPLVQVSRHGLRTTLWGQVRPGAGAQAYRLQRLSQGRWRPVGASSRTSGRGFFTRVVSAPPGAKLRIWSPSQDAASPTLVVS
jgi:hypothetical protein